MQDSTFWWRGGIIYQIYPRSFMDANNDGIGDLPGVTEKLDYVASLGVDGIWLSPFFTSPMLDFGYDISNYRDVDPMFGTLEDFKTLLDRAHALGLKVIIDQVISHTSDQHPWFQESRTDRYNSKADWYVWADPKPDGTPPNNWLSIFGGSAWTFDSRRRQYYLHNFLTSQPDLNFHNPQVRAAQLDNMRFWLELGVDGFRLDTVNFYFHDQELRDNPPVPKGEAKTLGAPDANPYTWQRHIYDLSRPENLDFLQHLRALMDEFPGTTTVGEIGDDNPLERMAEYTAGGDKLHMAYTFDLLNEPHSPSYIREVLERFQRLAGDAWPCWALSNHDVVRSATRWGVDEDPIAYPKVALALLLSLRGSVCLYQGEELGLPEANVPYERIQDPYGKVLWPEFKGRDGCRTPMPWTRDEHGGFSSVAPWLPVEKRHLSLAVEAQQDDAASMLNTTRRLLAFRQTHPALFDGDLTLVDVGEELLGFIREGHGERLLCIFNLGSETRRTRLPEHGQPLDGHGFQTELVDGTLTLPPYQAAYFQLGR
ncbi:alpha-glucosidase [Litchfieldella anticariensis FP35 = DSM 16096]|uniref:Alpha-glucosidase n=1 Tax=Litchfieldella anticariensis (strain DSM 16096 / CECT 5854 / CIP 108499 / LMG 22089 / FP35) TaxID=1121939 RepID=S2KKZ5_LITA3|nr:alpha-amylase family glycosyl hydrolase [Halomonas anticariensis]EPC01108.1 alpha-glucosidase [Halomonas anticariensis FP35 = DSM 16096]